MSPIIAAHCADIHLHEGATCSGKLLRNSNGDNIRFLDRKRCWRCFVSGAIEAEADFALLSGDLYEGPHPTPGEQVAANEGIDALCEVMPVILIADNHGDPGGTKAHAIAPLVGRRPGLFVAERPGTTVLDLGEKGSVFIACLPTPRRSMLVGEAGGSHEAVNERVNQGISKILRALRAQAQDHEGPKILVAHGIVRGSVPQVGEGGICFDPSDLEGWDYVALGDVHDFEAPTGCDRARYAGSLDRTDFGEEKLTPGWNLVQLHKETFVVYRTDTPSRCHVTFALDDLPKSTEIPPWADGHPSAPLVRCLDTVTQEVYDAAAPILADWRAYPGFVERIDVTRETRSRNAEMSAELGDEAALRMWCAERPEMEALVEAHKALGG